MSLKATTGWLAAVLLLIALWAIFFYAPLEQTMREVQKIFYIHVGTAWNAFLAFFVVFLGSVLYLRTRDERWDDVAAVSGEIGVLFTTVVLLTGPIWAKSAWNTWWTWEPRLTTTLVLWFIYLAYLLVRAGVVEETRRATIAAAFGIVGFADVPIVYLSVHWWRLSHPVIFGPGGGGLHPAMLVALIISVFAFMALYFYLLQMGLDGRRLQRRVRRLKERLQERYE